jgi:3-carboxy-cis,cis-muconate cycloisomerase
MAGLLGALDGDPAVDRCVNDAALAKALLDVEVALARAVAEVGLVPARAAAAVATAAGRLDVDVDDIGARATAAGNPVVPLVEDLVAAVPDDARGAVHYGATSQDVLDTAFQLVARRALDPLIGHLRRAGDAAGALADAHRDTMMVARTLGQPALPSTFGLRAASWLAGLDEATSWLARVRAGGLAVQLGGAAGTLAGYGTRGPDVVRSLAAGLGLADPGLPWHTDRSRIHELGVALGSAVAACGKVATDVIWLSQPELGEVAEGAPGGSSALPHKRNPVTSVLVVAAARRVPGLVATLLASGMHEQERATGSWHAEWATQRDLLRLAGGAASRAADVLDGLRIEPDAMRRNLDVAGPAVMSEALARRLTPVLGRVEAQRAVRDALLGGPSGSDALVALLRADPKVAEAVTADELGALLDPAGYTGAAGALIDRALGGHSEDEDT